MTVKHATAGAFVFSRFPTGWRLALIAHPRLDRWMIPGGHVEDDESQTQAALREVTEETGLRVRLLPVPAPPLPAGFPHAQVPPPWWITEQDVPADNHLREPHVHVDHQYVAVSESAQPSHRGVHPLRWCAAHELATLTMFHDTRLLAGVLFSCVDGLADGRLDPADTLSPFMAAAV